MPAESSEFPSTVLKRDGHLVPFEADKISQSLYAVTEELGKPSAFLARELADAVLHFLADEVDKEQASTALISEVIVKVVRELGHPGLAQAYAEAQRRKRHETPAMTERAKAARMEGTFAFQAQDEPEAARRRFLRAYSLQAVFARDLAAAHEEGLIALGSLEYPTELAGIVVDPGDGMDGWLAIVDAPARLLILDGPEHALTEHTAKAWIHGLARLCSATDRMAVLNLRTAVPPAWTGAAAQGPLFAPVTGADPQQAERVASILLEEVCRLDKSAVRAHWHLGAGDFADTARLQPLASWALERGGVDFVLDRPKREIDIAPGLKRHHPAILLEVGLGLPRFLDLAGIDRDAAAFLRKLPSLARMAVRAGMRKRAFLRLRGGPALGRGFLLDRSILLVVPLGLDRVVRELLGNGIAGSALALDFAKQIVESLHDTLACESRSNGLDISVDGPRGEFPGLAGPLNKGLLEVAGILHEIAGYGTVPLLGVSPSELSALLQHAWKKSDVVRLAGKS